jgi:hypothetical protein
MFTNGKNMLLLNKIYTPEEVIASIDAVTRTISETYRKWLRISAIIPESWSEGIRQI